MTKNVFLYHNHCDDGFGAAWSAWKKFGNKAEYIGVNHGDPYPKGLEGKNVYTLDFAYPPRETEEILKKAAHLAIIDHHKTAKDSIKLVSDHLYQMNRSGAVLSWQYFHPDKKVPKFLQYIEDADLWRWKLAHSREISTSLRSYDQDFKIWDKIAKDMEKVKTRKKYIEEGKVLLKSDERKVRHAVDNAVLVKFFGYKTFASNSFHFSSQIGHKLYNKLPPIGIIWSERKNKRVISLRSNGTVDVSELAKKFPGGGGHKNSAGFELKLDQKLPWEVISDKLV